jgi:hypothetical protein
VLPSWQPQIKDNCAVELLTYDSEYFETPNLCLAVIYDGIGCDKPFVDISLAVQLSGGTSDYVLIRMCTVICTNDQIVQRRQMFSGPTPQKNLLRPRLNIYNLYKI